jgi:crotonobetainyl-CoA:carnitine CoA-transferase CaiB-like acyl-CoA transferase
MAHLTTALNGVVVVSIEQAVSAPLATRYLADLGATVVKIERPEGDFARAYDNVVNGQATFFVWANRGKQSLTLDLKNDEDRNRLMELVRGSDVFIQNLAPESARRLGITANDMRAQQPELIAIDISGYGDAGPRSNDKAYDLAIQAEAGIFAVTGGQEMSKAGISVADIATATVVTNSVLAALVNRERNGQGETISVSMLDALTDWMAPALYGSAYTGIEPPRSGRRHHSIAPYGTFHLDDGSTVLIAIQNEREWQRFAQDVLVSDELSTHSDFAGNAQRFRNVDRLEELIQVSLKRLPAHDMRTLLATHAITTANVNNLEDVWNHPQLRARDRFVVTDIPGGHAEMLRSPFDDGSSRPLSVPALGEHDATLIADIISRGRSKRD